MPFRFRRSVRLFPGVRLNLSRSGMSVSVGAPGLSVNLGPRGHAVTVGLPGTGLSYRHAFRSPVPARTSSVPTAPPGSGPPASEPALQPSEPQAGQIRSADVAELTSPDLAGLKRLLNDAAEQRASLQPDLAAALKSRLQAWRKLRRREQLPLRPFVGKAVPRAEEGYAAAEREALNVATAIAQSEIRIDFQLGPEAADAYAALTRAHTALARSARIWDVTASVGIDRVRARSVASSAIDRIPVGLSRVTDSIVASAAAGLRFGNANGSDLDIFPGLLLMRSRGSHDYALVDLRDLRLEAQPRAFVEEEAVPPDAPVIDHAWAKANRDGSPDRRFRDNRQIPVVRYGELRFATPGGVTEAYHVSNCDAALTFGAAYDALQAALSRQAQSGAPVTSDPTPPDREISLPPLPAVAGAHEFTALFLAVLCMPLALLWRPELLPSDGSRAPVPLVQEQAASPIPSPDAASPTPLPAPADQRIAPPRDRVTTVRTANLRQRPDPSAPVVRVLNAASSFAVFDRQGTWVQVGDSTPAGWVHASLVKAAP